VGCGTGGLLRQLAATPGVEAVGLDVYPTALRLCPSAGIRGLVLGSAERLPFASDTFHAVTALDVLEHLEDDRAAVREIARVLVLGGVVVATVPAYQWLWSGHDEALHHRRRYVASEIRRLFTDAGLQVSRLTYLLTALFPLAAALRMKERLTKRARDFQAALIPVPRPINRWLIALHAAEAAVAERIGLPYGLSVLVVARKPLRTP
ncbi:MAG: class I SAM-dependent methyltransferase, partial [Armatimonadetes bacterium]|nr:class I SAM-dependent methyltransferase [Armatimonadota bacterium]